MLNGVLGDYNSTNNEYKVTTIDLESLIKLNLNLNLFYCIQDELTKTEVCKMLKYKKEFTKEQLKEMKDNEQRKILFRIKF